MGRFQYEMIRMVNVLLVLPSLASPKDEDNGTIGFLQNIQYRTRDHLPAKMNMTPRAAVGNGQNIIEQQHPLLRPMLQCTLMVHFIQSLILGANVIQ